MYNNPNFYSYPNFFTKPSLLSRIKTINFTEFLNGTQKTLNIINQALPIFYQIKPLINNTKTIFKIANAINNDSVKTKTPAPSNTKTNQNPKKQNINYNEPTFFI